VAYIKARRITTLLPVNNNRHESLIKYYIFQETTGDKTLSEKMPVTEVKLILDSNLALNGEFLLKDEISDYFKIAHAQQHMKLWYLDTPGQALKSEGWILRYRYHEGLDFELTFKKRYDENVYKELPEKALHEFKDFKQEIDMGFSKKTYSFSYVKNFDMNGDFFNLDLNEARRLSIVNSPSVFTDWNGKNEGFKRLCGSVLYGPVTAAEYKGEYEDREATFEIWNLGGYLTELSFKVDTDKSLDLQQKLLADANIKRLVVPGGTLKTEALFDYYSKHKELTSSG